MSVSYPTFTSSSTMNTPAEYTPPEQPPVTNEITPEIEPQPTAETRTMQSPLGSGKSPVSEIHEVAVQRGEQLEWIQESECGPAHCKLFSMKVVLGPYEATGSGKSKKIAKQVAAETLLKQLHENLAGVQNTDTGTSQTYGPQLPTAQPWNINTTTNTNKVAANISGSKSSVPIPNSNPVSRLQEVTSKHGLGFPEYEVVCENGPLALQKFDIKVKVKEMVCTGLGRSKKTAKRNAAEAMLDQLSKTNTTIQPPQKRMMFVRASATTEDNGTS